MKVSRRRRDWAFSARQVESFPVLNSSNFFRKSERSIYLNHKYRKYPLESFLFPSEFSPNSEYPSESIQNPSKSVLNPPESLKEAEVSRRRRDWAFSERDKSVRERESVRAHSEKLRRERDRAVSDLAVALRDADDSKKQRDRLMQRARYVALFI